MMLLVNLVVMLVMFYVLAHVCSTYFIQSLDAIAEKWKMSSEAAGATLMAIGSSTPELFITILALIRVGNHGSIGVGTIVGSALYNILVIIGAAVVVKGAKVMWQPIVRDLFFYTLTIVLLIFSFLDGKIELIEAVSFVALYMVYVWAVVNWKKWLAYSESPIEIVSDEIKVLERKHPWRFISTPIKVLLAFIFPSAKHYWRMFFYSLGAISLVSWVLVENTIAIASGLGVSEVIISLTILAIGTSVPDTVSGVIVAKQGRLDMAISNAIGSNVFNILFALGVPWLLLFAQGAESISISSVSLLSSMILLFASLFLILFLFIAQKWQLSKRSGVLLIGLYLVYLLWVILT